MQACLTLLAHTSLYRYYVQQKAYDHLAGSNFKDDVKRMERGARERAAEAQMLDSLYQVSDLFIMTEPPHLAIAN